MSIVAGLIAGGVGIAQGLLQEDQQDRANAQSKENLLLQLADNERDRGTRLEQSRISADAALAAAGMQAETAKKRILGEAIMDKGKDSGTAMLSSLNNLERKPERFNQAASQLAAILAS